MFAPDLSTLDQGRPIDTHVLWTHEYGHIVEPALEVLAEAASVAAIAESLAERPRR